MYEYSVFMLTYCVFMYENRVCRLLYRSVDLKIRVFDLKSASPERFAVIGLELAEFERVISISD